MWMSYFHSPLITRRSFVSGSQIGHNLNLITRIIQCSMALEYQIIYMLCMTLSSLSHWDFFSHISQCSIEDADHISPVQNILMANEARAMYVERFLQNLFKWKVAIVRSKIIIRAINMRSLDILVMGSYNSIKLKKLITIIKVYVRKGNFVCQLLYVCNKKCL